MVRAMGLLRNGKPNVKALARRGDTEGLIDAVFYQDQAGAWAGDPSALGAPVREEAVRALAAVGPDEGRLAVIDALNDSSDLVRSAAVLVLAGWGEALPLAEAVAWLPTGHGHSRRLALRALESVARPGTASALAQALVHAVDEEPLRPSDARLLVELLDGEERPEAVEEVVQILLAALGDEREAVGDRAADLLTQLAPASLRAVTGALNGEPAQPRAASVLGRIGDLCAFEPLVDALDHPDPRMRSESCLALGELRDPRAAEPLLRATGDPDPAVRASAGAALDRMGAAAVVVGISALIRSAIESAVKATARPEGTATNGRRKPATRASAGGKPATRASAASKPANRASAANGAATPSRSRRNPG